MNMTNENCKATCFAAGYYLSEPNTPKSVGVDLHSPTVVDQLGMEMQAAITSIGETQVRYVVVPIV